MLAIDGEPPTRDEVPGPLAAPAADAPEKVCGCHPTMPDVRVYGQMSCLGCGWGWT
jgi:hypothetical protein